MRLLVWVLVAIIALIFLIPLALSTSLGPWIATKVDPALNIESLALNWISPQAVEGISYKAEGVDLQVKKVTLEKSLLQALFSPRDLGILVISSPDLKLNVSEREASASRSKQESEKNLFIPPISTLVIENGKIEVEGVALQNVDFTIHRIGGLNSFPFDLKALTTSEKGEGKVIGNGVFSGPHENFQPQAIDIQVDKFPLVTLDALLKEPLFVKAFGPTLSLKWKLKDHISTFQIDGERIKGGGNETLVIDWDPDPTLFSGIGKTHITLQPQKFLYQAVVTLKEPLSFLGPTLNINGTKEEIRLNADQLQISPITFSYRDKITLTAPVTGKLFRLPSPLKETSPLTFEIQSGSIKDSLSSLALVGKVLGGVETNDWKAAPFNAHLEKDAGGPLQFDGETTFASKDPDINSFLGGEGKIIFNGLGYPRDGNWEVDPLSFQLKTPLLQSDGHLVIYSQGMIDSHNPIAVHYLLTPGALKYLKSDLPPLLQDGNLTFELSFSEPLVFDQLDTWNFQTTTSAPLLKFEGFNLENLIGSLDLNGRTSKILATLDGKSSGKSFRGSSLSLDVVLSHWRQGNTPTFEKATHLLSANLTNFPTSLIPQARELLGDMVSLQADSSGSLSNATGTLSMDSRGVKGNFAWRSDENAFAFTSPHFEIDIPSPWFEPLLEPLPLTLVIDNLTIPRKSLFEGNGKGTLESASTLLLSKTDGKKIPIPSMRGNWNLDGSGLHFNLSTSNQGLSLIGGLKTKLPLSEPFQLKDFNINLLVRGVDLPASLLSLNPNFARLEPVLHPQFNIDLDLKLNQGEGSAVASLISQSGTLLVDGLFHQGWFFLKRPLELSLQMTPKIAEGLLGELIPLISSGARGRSPIRVSIDPRGFRLPLSPFELKDFEIGQAVIELDQLDVYPTKELGDVLSILSVSTTHGNSEPLWFTPLYLSFKDGVATLKRVDILISERLPIALWGKVDLLRDRVNLEIGLSAKTLEQAFRMKGLPKDYYLPISLKGSLDSPSIDKPKATAKIAALLAQMEGSAQGLLIGGVLDLISGGLISEGVPPPTTKPFPWETGEATQREQQPSDQEERPNTPLKKIFKGVEKGAKSILKKFK